MLTAAPVELRDVAVALAGRPVLRHVDLRVEQGELLAVMGAVLMLNRHYGWSDLLSGPGALEALRETVREDLLGASLIYVAAAAAGCVLLALPGATFAVVAGLLFVVLGLALFAAWLGEAARRSRLNDPAAIVAASTRRE